MLKVKDTFRVEYGCYGNWTKAVVVAVRDTEYSHIKEIDYTIPNYTGEEIHTTREVNGIIY